MRLVIIAGPYTSWDRIVVASAGRDHIGPYRLLKLVRAGKATQIWEAINSTDNNRFALKALHGQYCTDRAEIGALKHEYNVGRTLDHENVISIYDFNISREMPYVVMEIFDGPNLKQSLRQFPERVDRYLPEILLQSALGLGHVHERGWIHRDVKPDNFLLDEEGDVRLIDFSIAERLKRGLGRLLAGKSKVQGTLSYISPEQIRGEVLDARADIYSFGCMAFELVGGRLPYTGSSSNDLLNKHLRATVPSLVAANKNVTDEFAKLVASLMAKRADQRPSSMDDVCEALEKTRVVRVRPSNH